MEDNRLRRLSRRRQSRQRRERENESKIEDDHVDLEIGITDNNNSGPIHSSTPNDNTNIISTQRRTTLRRRRRYRRGVQSSSNVEEDGEYDNLEEGKHRDDSYSPRDKPERGIFVNQQPDLEEGKKQEQKEILSPSPTKRLTSAKPPRHSSPLPPTSTRHDTTTSTSRAAVVERTTAQPRQSLPIRHHNSSFLRAKPDEKLREKFKNRIRSPGEGIPEVHFIGEICEGVGFKDTYVSCKYYLEWGKSWSFLAGDADTSQTQYAASDDDGTNVWNHPIDVHFATASIQGWPRIVMQVWELDGYGRSILSGYGFAHLPTNTGYHELEIHCWRPCGSLREELQSYFLGTSSYLVDESVIFGKAWENRSQLVTISSGVVKMNVNVLLRFFNEHKVA